MSDARRWIEANNELEQINYDGNLRIGFCLCDVVAKMCGGELSVDSVWSVWGIVVGTITTLFVSTNTQSWSFGACCTVVGVAIFVCGY